MKGSFFKKAMALAMAAAIAASGAPDIPAQEVYAATTPQMQKVYEALKEIIEEKNEDYKPYFHYEASIENDSITISFVADSEDYPEFEPCVYDWDNGYITCHAAGDDYSTYSLLTGPVARAVEKTLGMDSGSISEYISALFQLSGEFDAPINSDYFEKSAPDENGKMDFKLYASQKYDAAKVSSVVDAVYFNDKVIANNMIEALGSDYTSSVIPAGKFVALADGNRYEFTLTIVERDQIDQRGIDSLKNLIATFKPEGYEDFAASYKGTKDEKNGVWTVSAPDEEFINDRAPSYAEGYGFIQVTFANPCFDVGDSVAMEAGAFTFININNGTAKSVKSSNSKVASLKKVGEGMYRVEFRKKGSSTVTATLKDGTVLKCVVTVTSNPSVKVGGKKFKSTKTYTVKKGKTLKVEISGKVFSINNKYSSSKSKVAKVSGKKDAETVRIKGLKKGKSTVTIKVNGVSFKIKVKVV